MDTSVRLVNDIKKLSPDSQTSCQPKMVCFSWIVHTAGVVVYCIETIMTIKMFDIQDIQAIIACLVLFSVLQTHPGSVTLQ